mmetsp:Transcript_123442/g.308465  ORF Transcript_123442/g.308465 Transcript_123442/m.308465 type:complete len:331 (-) Transcript_123442:91-1083(-)
MPARNFAPTRPKLYHSSAISFGNSEKATPKYGHLAEYMFGVVGILVSMVYLAGSICFMSGFPTWVESTGDWLFILGGIITVIQAGHSAHEAWTTWGHPDVQDEASEISKACKQERLQDEFFENMHYVVASVVFLAGCLLFMPGVYSNEVAEEYGHEAAAWCFIVGSLGFVLASYWNACGLAMAFGQQYMPGSREHRCMRLASISLCFGMLGGVCFVSGSIMYRPGYSKDCAAEAGTEGRFRQASLLGRLAARAHGAHRRRAHGFLRAGALAADHTLLTATAGASEGILCLNPEATGAWLYTIGSCLFLAQSVISMTCTVIMSAADGGKDH